MRSGCYTGNGQYAAGIGAGYGYGGVSSVGLLEITNSIVRAESGLYGAGIGGGYGANYGRSDVNSIAALNSTVFAVGHQAAAIGAGSSYLLNSTVEQILLINGCYNLTAYWGSGVGAGDEMPDAREHAFAHNVSIHGGRYTISARTAFGSTDRAQTRHLKLSGNIEATLNTITQFAIHAENSITFDSLILRARTNATLLVSRSVFSRTSELNIEFTRNSSDSELSMSLLHFGEIRNSSSVKLIIENQEWEQNIPFDDGLVGIMFSVPANSKFNVSLEHSIEGRSQLCCEGKSEFEVGETEAFFDIVEPCSAPSKTILPLWAILVISIGGSLLIAVVVIIIVRWYQKKKAAEIPVLKYILDDSAPEPRKPGCEVF